MMKSNDFHTKLSVVMSLILITVFTFTGCSQPESPIPVTGEATEVVIKITAVQLPSDTPVPPTLTPSDTPVSPTPPPSDTPLPPTPTATATQSITFDEMVGIYHIVEEFGGETSYLIFQLNEDGSFMYGVDFNFEFQTVEEPHITGEWWIEDGVFHIVDEEIKADFGVGWECQIGAEGTYEVIKQKDNSISFKRIEDPCVVDESGDGITSRYMILVFSPYKIGPPPQPTSTPTPS